MINFLVYLALIGALGFGVAYATSRFLRRLWPGQKTAGAVGAVVVTLLALWLFDRYGAPLIEVRAGSPGMGGLAWALTIISYAIALFAVALPALVFGILRGFAAQDNGDGNSTP